jgi:hypothetical protein
MLVWAHPPVSSRRRGSWLATAERWSARPRARCFDAYPCAATSAGRCRRISKSTTADAHPERHADVTAYPDAHGGPESDSHRQQAGDANPHANSVRCAGGHGNGH